LKKHAEDKITDDIIDLISIITCGDLKQSLNYLQIITNIDEPTIDKVYDIFEIPRIESINEIISSCLSKKIADKQKPYLLMQSLLDEGHDCDDILDVFLKVLTMTDLKIDDKTRMLKAVSKCYYITEYTQTNHHLFSMISECRG
jgi:DNA polymerase III delta prime subunit